MRHRCKNRYTICLLDLNILCSNVANTMFINLYVKEFVLDINSFIPFADFRSTPFKYKVDWIVSTWFEQTRSF